MAGSKLLNLKVKLIQNVRQEFRIWVLNGMTSSSGNIRTKTNSFSDVVYYQIVSIDKGGRSRDCAI